MLGYSHSTCEYPGIFAWCSFCIRGASKPGAVESLCICAPAKGRDSCCMRVIVFWTSRRSYVCGMELSEHIHVVFVTFLPLLLAIFSRVNEGKAMNIVLCALQCRGHLLWLVIDVQIMITAGLSLNIICLFCPHDKSVKQCKDIKVVSSSWKQT